jgi:hypothetical protein
LPTAPRAGRGKSGAPTRNSGWPRCGPSGCPIQLLLDTTTALCPSRDLANAFPPTQRLPERRPRGRNMTLMADDVATRYTGETRSVTRVPPWKRRPRKFAAATSTSCAARKVLMCCIPVGAARSQSGSPVGRRMPPATGLFDDSHLQGSPLVPLDKPSDPDNYSLTAKRLRIQFDGLSASLRCASQGGRLWQKRASGVFRQVDVTRTSQE